MRSFLLILACGLAACAGLLPAGLSSAAAADAPAGAPPAGVSEAILSCISSAPRAESFLLAAPLNFLHRDRPRFHSWFIVAHGGALDSSGVAALAPLLGGAVADRQPATSEPCPFNPDYALRFHGQGAPMDMLISSDYGRWCFLRGGTREGSYLVESAAVRDSLGALIHRLFPRLEPTEEGKSR